MGTPAGEGVAAEAVGDSGPAELAWAVWVRRAACAEGGSAAQLPAHIHADSSTSHPPNLTHPRTHELQNRRVQRRARRARRQRRQARQELPKHVAEDAAEEQPLQRGETVDKDSRRQR